MTLQEAIEAVRDYIADDCCDGQSTERAEAEMILLDALNTAQPRPAPPAEQGEKEI